MSVTAPTHYYQCDEASGALLDYITGAPANFTDNNSCGTAAGVINQARTFASASSRYFSSSDASFNRGTAHFSWCCWVMFTSDVTAFQCLISKDNITNRDYDLEFSQTVSKRFAFYEGTGGSIPVANNFGDVPLNTWVMVAFGWDGTNKWISVNAGTRNTAARASIASSTVAVNFGRRTAGDAYMNGRMDGIGYWNAYDLTDGELAEIYNSGAGSESWLPSATGVVSRNLFVRQAVNRASTY